jgi:hypothetical protein
VIAENKLRTFKQAATSRCSLDGTPKAEMLGLRSLTAGGGNVMNAWSEYLRGQAVIADRYAKKMTTAAAIKEFADIAESFRHDADVEDKNPTCKY